MVACADYPWIQHTDRVPLKHGFNTKARYPSIKLPRCECAYLRAGQGGGGADVVAADEVGCFRVGAGYVGSHADAARREQHARGRHGCA